MSNDTVSRSSTRTTNYSNNDDLFATSCPCPPSPTLSDSNSLIFERNVEDPYMATSNSPSNPVSKHGSTTNLLSRQYSNTYYNPKQRRTSRASSSNLAGVGGAPHSPPIESHSPEYVLPALDHRRTLENFVAPALDASCSIVTDDNADLDDLDIVYMRRPSSIIGLDMALGRTKSNSSATITNANNSVSASPSIPPLSLSRSYSNSNTNYSNNSVLSPSQENTRTLRFYSYADMLSDEMANSPSPSGGVRRPSLSHSFSSSYIKQNHQKPPLSTNFSNPFVKASNSNLSRRYSNTMLSRSPTNQSAQHQQRSRVPATNVITNNGTNNNNNNTTNNHNNTNDKSKIPQRSGRSNFHLESSGSDEFSTDDEEEPSPQQHPFSAQPSAPATSPANFLGPRVSRTSTQNSTNSAASTSPLFSIRTYSNGGGNIPSPSIIRRRESATMFQQPSQLPQASINDVLMCDDTLQTEKVGEALKKKISNRRDNSL